MFNFIIIFIKLIIAYYLFSSVIRAYKLQNKINYLEIKNRIKKLKLSDKSKDYNYILNYNGEEVEPEWQWVRNISFVYTWVDGSDAEFAYIKSKYNGGNRNIGSRDRSADELRYSLRSLKKYLPWHNGTIFIVTDNQTPEWLNFNYSNIKIINHHLIIPKYINPTFDSSTIECFLDRIPGIGDIFIYMNDDFFFNNFIHPAFFFTSHTFHPKIFRSREEIITKQNAETLIEENNIHYIYGASIYFTSQIIKKYFDINFIYTHLAHSPYVCYSSLFEPFRQFFQEELKVVFAHRFRSPYKPITLYLYQMLLFYSNSKLSYDSNNYYHYKLIEFRNNYLHQNSSLSKYMFELVPDEITKMFIKFSTVNDDSYLNFKQFIYLFNNKNILIYNINDRYNSNKSLCELTEYLITRYPYNNQFEKNKYVFLEKKYLSKLEYVNETMKEIDKINSNNKYKYRYFKKTFFNKNNLNYLKEYLEEKKNLCEHHNISKQEEREIDLLFNYHGRELEPEWNWVKNISIVYIIIEEDNLQINQLKYSLFSIEHYLPWFIGTIFIITQRKIKLLNINNQINIKIIDPKDIVPKKVYGKFTKEIIEMYLDKIPYITERFIYLNSNHFFKNYIHPKFFFSDDFFPKYNFISQLNEKTKINQNKAELSSFYKSYELIKKFFGKHYINDCRIFADSPISFYRDLFSPVRKLYLSNYLNGIQNFDLLPTYLLSTYNIYGTSQIYYPEYVAGFGDIRNISSTVINKNKTISYYGFDITSEFILDKTILNIDLMNDVEKSLSKLEASKVLFFSVNFKNKFEENELKLIKEFFKKIYNY